MEFILLEVNEEEAIERILFRQVCDHCNKIYNLKFSPSSNGEQCEECHGSLTKRLDDHGEVVRKRVYEFKEKMRSVIEYYSFESRLCVIDAQ